MLSESYKKLLQNKTNLNISILLSGLIMLSGFLSPLNSIANNNPSNKIDVEKKKIDVQKRLKEVQEKARTAKLAESKALKELHRINRKLHDTQGQLISNVKTVNRIETKIKHNENTLVRTQSQEQQLIDNAARRLREIYEGRRLSIIEMFFQAQSLQAMIDLLYYQERIAQQDRNVLEQLRRRAHDLEVSTGLLGSEKNKLGSLITEIAKKAQEITKQKSQQEQIAEKLRTQRAFYEQAEQQLAQESEALEQQILNLESDSEHSNAKKTVGSGHLSLPIKAPVTSPFGWRRHPIFGVKRFHSGIDLAGPNHASIKAADSGTVLFTGWYGGYGKVVIVSHGKNMATLYAHLSKVLVKKGQSVNKGDVLALEGTTGFSTGPHVHFEVRVNGKPNNPMQFVK